MKRILISALAVSFPLTLGQPAEAQDLASSIVGMWKATGQVRKELATGKTEKVFGEQPMGHWVFTKGGRTVVLIVAQDRKKPAGSTMTDAERLQLHRSMFAYSGTYKVDGTKLVINVEASWNQAWTGTEQVRQVELVGNKLTLITPQFKSLRDGVENIVTTTLERVE